MGRLIKNHLARLIVLTAATYQIAAGLHAIFWPKIFWDVFTQYFALPMKRYINANETFSSLDPIVKPSPVLQVLNILLGIGGLCWEYPLPLIIPNTAFHRSIAARLAIYPLSALAALLLYQGTNAGIYYLVGIGMYFWAYSEGEVRLLFRNNFYLLIFHRLFICRGK